jgi:hypothetical protein
MEGQEEASNSNDGLGLAGEEDQELEDKEPNPSTKKA